MPLSTEDKAQIQNFGILGAIVLIAVIFAPGPDYGVPIGIYGLHQSIKRSEKQLASEKDKLNQEQLRIDRIPALEQELRERQPEIERYEARLPKSTNIPELFRDIDRFKHYSDLDIIVQARLDPVDKGDYWELPIRIEARGTYDSIATFINQLERGQRFAQVKDLKMEEKPGQGVTGTEQQDYVKHDATMKISTFMFKDQMVVKDVKAESAGSKTASTGAASRKR